MIGTKIVKTPAAIALVCAVAGIGLVGCEDPELDGDAGSSTGSPSPEGDGDPLTGTEQITVGDHTVNVSCSGDAVEGRPTVVLLHGGGDDLTTMADFQEMLSENGRVCSYDRLGAGGSDQPDGSQDMDDIGETLTGVIDRVAGDEPVVLAGHSMGGLMAARYAPDHQDRVGGLVLLDATSPTAVGDLENRIPESTTGPAGDLRAQALAVFEGENPELFVFEDGEVGSAGDIPVEIIKHGVSQFAEVPEYGDGLEEDWVAGQEAWLELSSNSELSTAENAGHYIHIDQPDVAVEAIERVVSQAAN